MITEPGLTTASEISQAAKFVAAGLCIAIGGLGSAIGQGFIGGKACEAVGKRPESYKAVFNTMMAAAVLAETTTVFCLVIALMLLLVVK